MKHPNIMSQLKTEDKRPGSLWCRQHLTAGRRKIGPVHWRFWPTRWTELRVQHRVSEPPVKLFSATVAHRCRRPAVTLGITGRAMNTDVEVVVVMPLRPHLV